MHLVLILLLAAGALPAAAIAAVIDLTTLGATVTSQSVIFTQGAPTFGDTSSTFQPFSRVQATSVEQGFNTDFRPLEPDAVGTTLANHSLALGALRRRLITAPGPVGYYYEFHVDINETSLTGNNYLSIDQIKIYTATAPNLATYATLSSTGTLQYDLDVPGDQQVLLDGALTPGSGEADLTIQIPTSFFDSPAPSPYLYFFLRAGDAGVVGSRNYGSSGGFEEVLALVPRTATGVESEAASREGAPSIRPIGSASAEELGFRCAVPAAGHVSITLYDARGRAVGSYRRETSGASVFEAPWSAFRMRGMGASGIYFYRFDWNGVSRATGKVAVLR